MVLLSLKVNFSFVSSSPLFPFSTISLQSINPQTLLQNVETMTPAVKHTDVRIRKKKKKQKQNTTDKDLVFLHLQLLDSGVYFLATYILVSLSLSSIKWEQWYPPHRLLWELIEETYMNISTTLQRAHRGPSLIFMTVYAPRRQKELAFWSIIQIDI